jgi:hypothetical protein
MNSSVLISRYSIAEYPFASLLLSHFSAYVPLKKLELLHEAIPTDWLPASTITPETDQSTKCHEIAYRVMETRNSESNFLAVYRDFLKFAQRNHIGDYLVQRRPTLRFQFPNGLAVGSVHRDSEFGHLPETENIWIPLTSLNVTSTIWIEEHRSGELQPVIVNPGEYARFSGNLLHGNVKNQSSKTRVSMDFRIIDRRKVPENAKTFRTRYSKMPLFDSDRERSYFVEAQFV